MLPNEEIENITVMLDWRGKDRRLRPFYCLRCGKCVCEITADAHAVIPGEPSAVESGTMDVRNATRCNGTIYLGKGTRIKCTAKYFF